MPELLCKTSRDRFEENVLTDCDRSDKSKTWNCAIKRVLSLPLSSVHFA